jgi:hypothetical protein
MDMESVIGEQNINHRRKPAAIARDPGSKAFFAFNGFKGIGQGFSEGLRKRNGSIPPVPTARALAYATRAMRRGSSTTLQGPPYRPQPRLKSAYEARKRPPKRYRSSWNL